MEKLIEYCQTQYKIELDYKPTLANIFCWILFIISLHIAYTAKLPVFISGLNTIKLKLILDVIDGIIPNISITQPLISFIFVAGTMWTSRKLSEGLFFLFCLKSDFKKLIIDMTIIFLKQEMKSFKKTLGTQAKEKINTNKKRMKKTRSLAEVFLAGGACSLISLNFNIYNLLTAATGIIIFIAITWRSFHYFITDILPYSVAIQYSSDQLTDLEQTFNNSDQ